MITILLLSVIDRLGPGDDDDILVGLIPNTLAGHDKFALLNLTTVGTPTGASIAGAKEPRKNNLSNFIVGA